MKKLAKCTFQVVLLLGVAAMSVVACGSKDTVGPGTGNGTPTVTTVVVTPGNATLISLGETVQLTASAHDANGNTIVGKTFTWSSSDEGLAMVSSTGLVTAIGNGVATIMATTEGVQGSASLTVAQVASRVEVTPASATVFPPGATVQLAASAEDAKGNAISDKTFTWSSSDESIATVSSSGLVTAVANGSVTITATADGVDGTAAVEVGFNCFPDLPAPSLALKGTEDYEVSGQRYTRYWLTVTNRFDFPGELFQRAPDLPPCGLNSNAGRTWLDIFRGDGQLIGSFCALGTPASLDGISYPVREGAARPASVYITLADRRCGLTYVSNTLAIAGSQIFSATFSDDAVDMPPRMPEVGTWQDPISPTILVRSAVGDLTDKPVELDQIEGVIGGQRLAGSPTFTPTSGQWVVSWRSLVQSTNVFFAVVTLRQPPFGDPLGSVAYRPGGVLTRGFEVDPLPVSWTRGVSQFFEMTIDLDNRLLSLSIDGASVQGFQNVPFDRPGTVLGLVSMELGGTFAQTFAWDDIKIVRKVPAGVPVIR
jgi:hypothetical protein